jgi:ADP-heptose:LPS heptosyltransferase
MVNRLVSIALRELRANLNYHLAMKRGRSTAARNGELSGAGPGRVGIVRLDLIGDFVLFTAALPQYRAAYPGAVVTLFGNAAWRELALWLNEHRVAGESGLLFDEFVPVEPGKLVGYAYFNSLATQLRQCDVVVNAAYSRTNIGDKLIAASGRRSVGAQGDTVNILAGQKRLNDGLYSQLVLNSAAEAEWERNIDFVQALAPDAAIPRTPPLWRVSPELADASLARLSETSGVSFAAPFIAISPFASLPIKQWPLAHYRELVRRVMDTHAELRVMVLGGADKTREAVSLCDGLPPERVFNLVGKTSLVEAACLLYRARLSVSGDTAAGHLASAVGTPAVVVMGGGHYGRFFPYDAPHERGCNRAVIHRMGCFQCNWFCKYRRFSGAEPPCLEHITVDEVYAQCGLG